jgi:hypothetical protein
LFVGADAAEVNRLYLSEFYGAEEVCKWIIQCDVDLVCMEDFILYAGLGANAGNYRTSAARSGLAPVRITAMVNTYLGILEWEGVVAYSGAAQAKGVFTDARLRAAGLWVVGKPHVRDALRHALLGIRKARA